MKRIALFPLVLAFAIFLAACSPVASLLPGNTAPTATVQPAAPTVEATATSIPPTQTPETPSQVPTGTALPVDLHATLAALPAGPSYKDATYVIEGSLVTLVNGQAEQAAAPGSATRSVTRFFGNEAYGDLNGDGATDVAFLLTQSDGGSGTFYYVVVALKTASGYVGTNAILLGDRIAPQPTTVQDGKVIVNYADRNPGESFTTPPSLGVSRYLQVVDGELVEVK